jgi:phage recombination protein Bet
MEGDAKSTALVPTKDDRAILKATLCRDLTDAEFDLFLAVARRFDLDPFRRQICAVKRRSKNGPDTMVIQTQIDGYRAIARRNGLAGKDKPVFEYDEHRDLISATVTVYRWADAPNVGHKEAYTAIAYWDEYVQLVPQWENGKIVGRHPSDAWGRMGRTMLSKCAEALALRTGFSESLSGIYVEEELDHLANDETPPARVVQAGAGTRRRSPLEDE